MEISTGHHKSNGTDAVFVLGVPTFYPRRGFVPPLVRFAVYAPFEKRSLASRTPRSVLSRLRTLMRCLANDCNADTAADALPGVCWRSIRLQARHTHRCVAVVVAGPVVQSQSEARSLNRLSPATRSDHRDAGPSYLDVWALIFGIQTD